MQALYCAHNISTPNQKSLGILCVWCSFGIVEAVDMTCGEVTLVLLSRSFRSIYYFK